MSDAETLSTGQAIARSLIRNGVDTIFGIPGAHTYDFIDALHECRDKIRFIVNRHEQGSGYMAYGYAKSTGRVGAFTCVPGPGVLNAGAALCTAYGANAPVLCITGNIQSHNIGRGRGILHELPDQLAILRGLTKWAERINHPTPVGIVTDATLGARGLVDALSAGLVKRPSREEEFKTLKAQFTHDIQRVQPQMGYLDAIREVLPRDGFFVEEISQVGFASRFGFPVYQPRTFVTGGYQDNVGFGFMTALGVKIANPGKPVVSVTGDGGFMFGVQELATAVKYNINLVTIVFNNASYGNVLRDQRNVYKGREIGSSLTNPDFVKLAESFGAAGYLVKTPALLKAALERAFAQAGPVLIEVPSEPGSETSPWPFLHPSL